LLGTIGSCLLAGLSDGSIRRLMPRPLLWLYIVPILVGGARGSSHVRDIAPAYYVYDPLLFDDAAGYIRDRVVKPLQLVVFALLVGAAVARSAKPEKFLVPTLISIWVTCPMFIGLVFLSGVGLDALASTSRGVLTMLGQNPNELGPLYAFAYALLLFTWAESKEPGLRLVLLASMGMLVVALT